MIKAGEAPQKPIKVRGKYVCPDCGSALYRAESGKFSGQYICPNFMMVDITQKERMLKCNFPPYQNEMNADIEKYVVFDFETTGLNKKTCEPTELAALYVVDGKVVKEFDMFCKTKEPIPLNIQELTHITNEMIESKGRPLTDVLKEFCAFCEGAVLVGHNIANYDMPILTRVLKECQMDTIVGEGKYVDTLHVAKSVIPEIEVFGDGKRKSWSQGNIAKHYHVSYGVEGAHRAIADVRVLYAIFEKMKQEPAYNTQNFILSKNN